MMSRARGVERSLGDESSVAVARQCTHRKLQPFVTSQKINRGTKSFLLAPVVAIASLPARCSRVFGHLQDRKSITKARCFRSPTVVTPVTLSNLPPQIPRLRHNREERLLPSPMPPPYYLVVARAFPGPPSSSAASDPTSSTFFACTMSVATGTSIPTHFFTAYRSRFALISFLNFSFVVPPLNFSRSPSRNGSILVPQFSPEPSSKARQSSAH